MTAAEEWAALDANSRATIIEHLRALAKKNESAVDGFRSGGNTFWAAVCTSYARSLRAAIAALEEAGRTGGET